MILGKVVSVGAEEPTLAADGMPYTTVGYMNGLGYRDLGDETNADATYDLPAEAGRINLSSVNTEASGYHQEALVPLGSETHAGEDVTIYGKGPGGHLVSGTNEQSVIFHVINKSAQLEKKAEKQLNNRRWLPWWRR